ncbi:probable G-protein coupled receptor 33 [Protopterus annectens]|uniref:probable G-protein coupled receptor 33 n=1 Tax=Protopterus annectens TaxID=7888 RepID=UPI001CFBA0CD|nr:probable G-protein coupled receptor 33 [Protopterus annectens]
MAPDARMVSLPTTTFSETTNTNDSKGASAMQLIQVTLVFMVSFVGILGNGTCIWILGFKMKMTVHTIWFLQLICTYFLAAIVLLFAAITEAMNNNWIFGRAMCKLINSMTSFSMFASVFLLTVIAIDRCILILHPVWSKAYRTTKLCAMISLAVWLMAIMFSSPYLAFRDIQTDRNKTFCINNYVLEKGVNSSVFQAKSKRIHVVMYVIRLLFGFIIPLIIITVCYMIIGVKIKLRKFYKSSRSFQVIVAAVVSFFVCWFPYHVYSYMNIYKDSLPKTLLQVFRMLTFAFTCVNSCITPVIYVIVGQNFKLALKKSLFSLFENTFGETTMDKIYRVSQTNSVIHHDTELSEIHPNNRIRDTPLI